MRRQYRRRFGLLQQRGPIMHSFHREDTPVYGSAVMICERWQRGVFWPALRAASGARTSPKPNRTLSQTHLKTSIICLQGSSSRVGTNVKIVNADYLMVPMPVS